MTWIKKYLLAIASIFVVMFLALSATAPWLLASAWLGIREVPSYIENFINHTYEDFTMPTYASAEFKWGMDITSYELGLIKPVVSLEAFPYANRMTDASGNDVARVLFSGGAEWGRPSGALGSQTSDEVTSRLPKTLHLLYYDLQDKKVYQLKDAELPIEQIYNLFKAGFVDDLGNKRTYDTILVGLAPKGTIVVWVYSMYSRVHEVAHYQAQVITPSTELLAQYENYRGDGLETLKGREKYWGTELTAKIVAGMEPNPEPYIRKRIKYPWNATVTGIEARDFEYWRWTINEENDMVRLRTMPVERQKLKALPRQMELFFNHPNGNRYLYRVNFFTHDRVVGEPDISEIQSAFELLYPNRRPDMGDEIFSENEFATLEFQISQDLTELQVFVVKGKQRIEIKNITVQYAKIKPHSYSTLTNYEPSTEQLSRLRAEQVLLIRPYELCPQAGLWRCPNSNLPYEISLSKGDKVPFPYGLSENIDPTTIYWEWMRDLKPEERI